MAPCKANESSLVVFKSNQPLELSEAIEFVHSDKCGALNIFQGTIRDSDVGKQGTTTTGYMEPIKAIFYDAYTSMAERQVRDIIKCEMTRNDPNMRVYVGIRIGLVPVGESSILICVTSTGRQVSHKAVLAILNEIKSKVTIWKKIIYLDGSEQWATEKKSEAFWLAGKS